MDDFDQRFDKAFAMVAFAANRHLVDHMRRMIQELELDLESAMLWGMLAHLNVAHAIRPGAAPSELLSSDGFLLGEHHPVRLTDLVQVSGLPKETVRRKLDKLRQLGKVRRTDNGRWDVLRDGVDDQAYAFTRESVRRLLQTARVIEGILQHARPDQA
ncbi:DeoR family transcriptional regulator [Parazoarcus communis]|uniref:HTH deoR-type domain-containing protein n=1 Tax=Parazoarcus communis SWub3 = DSM 12120 TaxID=1121029 RepID=A0A323V1Q3_9RHOO|nr:DeoR family transcriptional regulator [Parazoarcus communis]NMG69747.1 DeoR family transcriptional regulator [Parazoarcus communis SWub3 = DSM 12120]PZA18043.1 hypothetical protein DNK49_00395 [Azoarcus communis] [Parazoarcus communis SWub3 = DSM 12120]